MKAIIGRRQELAKTGCGKKTDTRAMMWIKTRSIFSAEARRGVNSTIFDTQGSRIDNDLDKRDHGTGQKRFQQNHKETTAKGIRRSWRFSRLEDSEERGDRYSLDGR